MGTMAHRVAGSTHRDGASGTLGLPHLAQQVLALAHNGVACPPPRPNQLNQSLWDQGLCFVILVPW